MNRRKPDVPVENDSEYLTVHRFEIMECLKNFERDLNRNPIIECSESEREQRDAGDRREEENRAEKKKSILSFYYKERSYFPISLLFRMIPNGSRKRRRKRQKKTEP